MILTNLGEIYHTKALRNRVRAAKLGLRAVYYLKRAFQLKPDNPETLFWYATVLLKHKKDAKTARTLFQKCLETELSKEKRKQMEKILETLTT